MEKQKINDITYFFPTSWSDITLEQFLQLRELESRAENFDEYEYSVEYLHILTSVDKEDILKTSVIELSGCFDKVKAMTKQSLESSKAPIFKFNNEYYVFDENLTGGQFIDLINITKGKEWWSVSDEICSVFIRKAKLKESKFYKILLKKELKKEDFVIEPYDHFKAKETAKMFRKYLGMDIIYTCKCFFLTLKEAL